MYLVRFENDCVIKSKYHLLDFVLCYYSVFGNQDASFWSLFYIIGQQKRPGLVSIVEFEYRDFQVIRNY